MVSYSATAGCASLGPEVGQPELLSRVEQDFDLGTDRQLYRVALDDAGHHPDPFVEVDVGDGEGQVVGEPRIDHRVRRGDGEDRSPARRLHPAQVGGPALGAQLSW